MTIQTDTGGVPRKIPQGSSPVERKTGKSNFVGFMINAAIALVILTGASFAFAWQSDRHDRQFAQEQRQEIAKGIGLTSKGCPAVAPKIREIGSDGDYSKREVEVMLSLVTIEQAKPNGFAACRAPSWRWFWGGWVVSDGYVD
jgi:hypothetical protein